MYSRYVLTTSQLKEILCLECETLYTCGSPLSPSDDPLFVVREGITSSIPVEFAYYSCKHFSANDECSVNATLKEQYPTVLTDCESSGKKAITSGEYKDGEI